MEVETAQKMTESNADFAHRSLPDLSDSQAAGMERTQGSGATGTADEIDDGLAGEGCDAVEATGRRGIPWREEASSALDSRARTAGRSELMESTVRA